MKSYIKFIGKDKMYKVQKEINVEMVNLTPTMRCNLKCKLCGVLVPHYSYCPQMAKDEFINSLKAVFEIIDHVNKLQITGGEPFIHPQLAELVEACFEYKKQFGKLWIFTNGTVPLSAKMLDILKRYNSDILIHISDYGLRREITTKLIEDIEKTGCQYRYLKYYGEQQYFDGWVDQGDFISHNRNEKDMEEVFEHCPHVCRGGSWYVRNGQMHWCGRSIRGFELEKIPLKEGEYLNIYEGNIEERRDKFKNLMKLKSITACNYCNGNYGTNQEDKRYPAGQQM